MYHLFKRILDITVASLLLIVLGPVMAITACLVRWNLGSPIIFGQERAGQFGRPFFIFKFRTMTQDKDPQGQLLPDQMRLTAFGHCLRSTSLDELPQLLNVLRGDISLVGPRPLYIQYLSRYSEDQKRRILVPQGITGLAQINGRNETTWEDRLIWDTKYVDTASFILDLRIIFLTFSRVLFRKGISRKGHATMPEFKGSNHHPPT
jgi:sugar transferase EpsL